ncbi:CD109 antigen-like [Eupeodes corollae]|uniref:CD109 antigen-like n=1 Tax=Eupeodes corollae TaxID=290404 RepID=UPI0024909B2A|nr:CD109 antigen-like [Eupeodes corollae]
MSVKVRLAFIWITLLQFSFLRGVLSLKKGYYTIVSPSHVEPESTFHISLTLNDFYKSCWFNVSLTTFVREEKFHDFGSIEVEPGTTKLVELKAPSYEYRIGNLEVTGFSGIISKDSTSIYFGLNKLWIFIQTNKDKYRPGELVEIRVICVDQLTRPEKVNKTVNVEISDGKYNLVKGLYNVKFKQGVLKAEIQLSNNPVLGLWRIRVDGVNTYTDKRFEVDRYVLPKYNVNIDAKIIKKDNKNQVQLEISASLTTFVREEKFHDFGSIEVEPGTTKLVELKAPSYEYRIGNLEVTGFSGIISKDSTSIYFGLNKLWIFIQTNKDKYRPGELVEIRVICVDQLTRPEKVNKTVEISDGKYNLVKGLYNVKFKQGVLKAEIQLSNNPVLGLWRIRVDGVNTYTDKRFEVDRYVLPKYNVNIDAKIIKKDNKNQVQLEISASYFYGEPVKGDLSLSFINTGVPTDAWVPTLSTVNQESRIDGQTTIYLDLEDYIRLKHDNNKDQKPSSPYFMSPSIFVFSIEAHVFDDISKEKASAETEVSVYSKSYHIEIEAPEEFESYSRDILKFKLKVTLRDITDTIIKDPKDPIEVVVGCGIVIKYQRDYNKFDKIRVGYQNEPGKDYGLINMTNKDYNECFVFAEYQDVKSSTKRMYRREEVFDIDILTESPEEGKEFEVKISNPEPLEEFSYEILVRGDIIQSGLVVVPGNQTSYILRLNATSLMVPKITLYAHHIKDMKFGGQMKDVVIQKSLKNSIVIKTVKETEPGKPVNINVTTNEGSYVGLMALDSSALQNVIKENIFDEEFVKKKLRQYNSERVYPIPSYGLSVSVITFSNIFPPGTRENGPGGDDEPAGGGDEPRVRNLFPDSWLFKDFERTPKGGIINFMETPPDSITTWAITGFSLHPETGLTFTKNITNLRVFQEFFISMDLPSLVKEGEIIEVPIYVSNYMTQDLVTNLTIESNSDEGLDILENPESSSKSKQNLPELTISKKKREKFIFFLKPIKSGFYNVTVTAISSLASDAIQKVLKVQSQGIPYEMTKSFLIHLQDEETTQKNEIIIDFPGNVVDGSQKVEISAFGDIFRPLVRHLEKVAKVPYGNNEDNIRLFLTNSIALKYLKALNSLDSSLESKMILNLELGYQNELSFKYLDGSFGLFERKKDERTGDIWQTIFALWGLVYAEDLISVDSKVIARGLEYLESKQQENGCYKSEDDVLEENIKLTAFGLMVFFMDEDSGDKYKKVIEKGLAYLYEASIDLKYSPISVVSAYVLHLGKHEKAGEYLRKLTSNISSATKQNLWTKSDTLQSHLETIAGSLMNFFESQEISDQNILHIVRGLIVPKQEESSITHMVALQAMIAFAEKLSMRKTDLNIHFKDDRNVTGDFQLNEENAQVLQTIELAESSKKIQIQSKGSGFAIVDVKYEYNILPENQSSNFYFTNISVEIYSDFLIYVPICSKVLSSNSRNKFIVMEVSLQSGYIFTDGNYNDIDSQNDNIKSIQFNDGRDKAIIYFDYDPENEVCIELEARKTYKVINSKPGWVVVYGEYDKDSKSINSFMVAEV